MVMVMLAHHFLVWVRLEWKESGGGDAQSSSVVANKRVAESGL
jgi:hypothetical protein